MKFTIILSGFALASTALAVALPGGMSLYVHLLYICKLTNTMKQTAV